MAALWFVIPAHGRLRLTRICLSQLRRTCDALEADGVRASAVVVACDENLDTARELGFATVERNNAYLSRRFNDGIQLALDPRHNPFPADYVVPCGSDDWVDHRLFLDLPPDDTMVGFQRLAVVREDGRELTVRQLNYPGGAGIRIYPAALMEPLGYRPADEDRKRACDTSILVNVARHHGDDMKVVHHHLHDHQLVDWKSPSEQLNSYGQLAAVHRAGAQFEARLDTRAEARAVARGSIQLLERIPADLVPGSFRLPSGWPAHKAGKEVS
jgi:hypothetical protein